MLVVPSNNWMTHPNPMRHHFLFRRLADTHGCEVFVLGFTGLGGQRPIINLELVSSPRSAESMNGEDLAIDAILTNQSSKDFGVVKFRSSLRLNTGKENRRLADSSGKRETTHQVYSAVYVSWKIQELSIRSLGRAEEPPVQPDGYTAQSV